MRGRRIANASRGTRQAKGPRHGSQFKAGWDSGGRSESSVGCSGDPRGFYTWQRVIVSRYSITKTKEGITVGHRRGQCICDLRGHGIGTPARMMGRPCLVEENIAKGEITMGRAARAFKAVARHARGEVSTTRERERDRTTFANHILSTQRLSCETSRGLQ